MVDPPDESRPDPRPLDPAPRPLPPPAYPPDRREQIERVKEGVRRVGSVTGEFTRTNNVLAIVALIVAVAGIPTYLLAAVGAILGHIALRQIRKTGQAGAGMAKGAIFLGWTIVAIETVTVCGLAITALVAGLPILDWIIGLIF